MIFDIRFNQSRDILDLDEYPWQLNAVLYTNQLHGSPTPKRSRHIVKPINRIQVIDQVQQLAIPGVVNVRPDGDRIRRLQHVRVRIVIDNDRLPQTTTQSRQILHESALHGTTGVPVQSILDVSFSIQHVEQRIRVLAQAGREYHHFELAGHRLQEAVDIGALEDVDGGHSALDLDVDDEVVVAGGLEGGVDEGFIEVQDQRLLAMVLSPHGRQVHNAHAFCPVRVVLACCSIIRSLSPI